MTKSAKGILIAVAGAGVLGGIFVVFLAAIIGVGMIAAAGEEENDNSNIAASRDGSKRSRESSGIRSKRSNAAGSIPAEMVGRWVKREGGGETDFTGKSRYRSHRIYVYEFSADGSVKYTFDRETLTIMQCEIKERRAADGTAATEGDTIVVNLDEGVAAESNSCEGGETVEKQMPEETRRLKWNLKTETGAPELCLTEANGEVCYAKF